MATRRHVLNLEQALNRPEEKRFESTMSERFGRTMTIPTTPLKEFVAVDTGLLEVKVASLMLQGAYDEAGYWRDLINVYPMSNEKEVISLASMRNYAVRTGKVSRKSKEDSGGKYDSITLDVSNENNDRYVYLNVDGRDLEMKRWLSIENSIRDAGRTFGKQIRDDIIGQYLNDVGTTVALGGNLRYTSIISLASTMNKAGFELDTIIIDSDDFTQALTEETTGGNMPWLNSLIAGQMAEQVRASIGNLNGLIGYMNGKIPIYVVGNTGNSTILNAAVNLNGTLLGVDSDRAEVLGLHKDLTITNAIDTLSGLQEAAIVARYCITKASGAGVGSVSGV